MQQHVVGQPEPCFSTQVQSWAKHCSILQCCVVAAASSIDLAPLLYNPADFEAKLTDAASKNNSVPTSHAPSVLDAIHSLGQQCHVFKKSAEQLGEPTFLPTLHFLPCFVVQAGPTPKASSAHVMSYNFCNHGLELPPVPVSRQHMALLVALHE